MKEFEEYCLEVDLIYPKGMLSGNLTKHKIKFHCYIPLISSQGIIKSNLTTKVPPLRIVYTSHSPTVVVAITFINFTFPGKNRVEILFKHFSL